jgi:hypothetical protein
VERWGWQEADTGEGIEVLSNYSKAAKDVYFKETI